MLNVSWISEMIRDNLCAFSFDIINTILTPKIWPYRFERTDLDV